MPHVPLYQSAYRRLFWQSLAILLLGFIAAVLCYFFVDRPVAFYVRRHDIDHHDLFRWLTYPPPILQTWSPLLLVLLLAYRAWRPFSRWQKTLAVACVSLIIAHQFRTSLGELCGRYWPETWFNNPSLIGTGDYGFHPFRAFRSGTDVGSFPSGHASRLLAFGTVWWIAIRRSRLALVVVILPMLVSLVAMNYHFVGDVVAGSLLGIIIGLYATHLARLDQPSSTSSLARR